MLIKLSDKYQKEFMKYYLTVNPHGGAKKGLGILKNIQPNSLSKPKNEKQHINFRDFRRVMGPMVIANWIWALIVGAK